MHENILDILKMEREKRLEFGYRVAENLKEKLIKKYQYDEGKADAFILDVCRLFCLGDSSLNAKEKSLFSRILKRDISDLEFLEMMSGGNEEDFINKMKESFKKLDYEDRLSGVYIGIAFITIDDKVNEKEEELINILLR